MRRTLKAAIICGALILPPSVLASNWAPFERQESAGRVEHFEWDADSLTSDDGAPRFVSVTWRRYATTRLSPAPETREIFKSRIYCQDFGLSTYSREQTLARKDGAPGMRLGPGIESALTDKPTAWPTWGSPEGKLIRMACQVAAPGWLPDFLLAHEYECASKTTGMCSPDRQELAYSLSLLLYRKQQAVSTCASSLDAAGKAAFATLADISVADVLAEAGQCRDSTCQALAVNWMLSKISGDLERAGRGQQCEAFQQRADKISREKQMARGMEVARTYLACAASKAPTLDDGLSAAESVATALHSACLPVFDAAADLLLQHPESRQLLAGQLRPKLIEIVLQHRAAQRAPKPPAARPEAGKRIQS